MLMKINELREGDRFTSTNPEVVGEGLVIAHKLYNENLTDLAILWGGVYEEIDKLHFWWDLPCILVNSNTDVTVYQQRFNRTSKNIKDEH